MRLGAARLTPLAPSKPAEGPRKAQACDRDALWTRVARRVRSIVERDFVPRHPQERKKKSGRADFSAEETLIPCALAQIDRRDDVGIDAGDFPNVAHRVGAAKQIAQLANARELFVEVTFDLRNLAPFDRIEGCVRRLARACRAPR